RRAKPRHGRAGARPSRRTEQPQESSLEDGAATLISLTPEIRAVVEHARSVRRRSTLVILGAAGLAMLWAFGGIRPPGMGSGAAQQPRAQMSSQIVVLVIAVWAGIWASSRMLSMGPPPGENAGDEANSYTRSVGTVQLCSEPVRQYGRAFSLTTPAGDTFKIS